MLHEYDVVRLKKNLLAKNLRAGSLGTVVMIHDGPNLPHTYEVEFVDEKGNSLALITVTEDEIENE